MTHPNTPAISIACLEPMPFEEGRCFEIDTDIGNTDNAFEGLLSLADIRRGLDRQEFVPCYQPKILLDTGVLKGAETLARWQHPVLGLLTPRCFLSVIESHGLIDQLFTQIFHQGLALYRDLSGSGCAVELAFNLQPGQLTAPTFAREIERSLRRYQCPSSDVVFEITESGSIKLPLVSLGNLLQLRMSGCGLSMDDFGSGYSSLERLCDLPFTELKLDASFVRKLDSHPASRTLIASTVGLARALGISLVVEGVETHAQQQQLKALGCSIAQGYSLACPMLADEFKRYCWAQSER